MNEPDKTKRVSAGKAASRPRDFDIINLGDYYAMIRERWFLGLVCAMLVSILVGYFLLNRPPTYEAQAAIMWDQNERILDIPQVVDTGLDGAGGMWTVRLRNHMNRILTQSFRAEVADTFSEEEQRRIIAPYLPEDESGPMPSVVGALGAVQVMSEPNSFMLRIMVRHRDPEVAAMVANRYAERYIELARERGDTGTEQAIESLQAWAEEFRLRVTEAEEALQDYRREHNLVSVEENQNLVVQRLNSLNASLTTARLERLDLERELRQVEQLDDEGANLLELGRLVSGGTTDALVSRIEQLRSQREVMSERYLERHFRMIENQREIESVEELIRENVDRTIADLRNRLNGAREREELLRAELDEAEAESLALDRMRIEYTGLQRAAEGARQSHAQILERLNEMAITSQMQGANIQIVNHARVPGSPVDPDPARIAILVFFLGGFFFVGTPIGLGMLDQKMKSALDVEKLLNTTLLAELPEVSRIKEKERPHIVEKGLEDRTAEAFRGLVNSLRINWDNGFPRALVVTSTLPREGKSFFVSNLGYAFAAHGKKTLLIDFDFRRPSLHQIFGVPNNAGIIRWLWEGGLIPKNILNEKILGIKEVLPNLYVLPAGGATKEATEAISNPAVGRLVATLKKEFDLLVMDTPPIGIFPDAFALAAIADNSVHVNRFGTVDRRQVQTVVGRLRGADPGFMGVVMNGMPKGKRYAHYYSDYGCGNYKYEKYYAMRD